MIISKALMSGITKLLRKLIKYLNGTTILTYFVLPSLEVLPIIFTLNSNDSESLKVAFGLYL